MDFFLLIFLLVLIYGMHYNGGNNDDYISRDQTKCINGFLVLTVFMRHFKQYINFGDYDHVFEVADTWAGQLIVVPILFFSGYGIMLSIMKKGDSYVNSILTKRFVKVWAHFIAAVALFIPVDIIVGREIGKKKILLSFLGWDSLGNSNWYIFATLVLYIFTFVIFKIFRKNHAAALYFMVLLSIGYMIAMMQFKKGQYWYNTAIAYSLGMVYAYIKPKAESVLRKSYNSTLTAAFVGIAAILIGYEFKKNIIMYEVYVIGFIVVLLIASMKFRIGNSVLHFFGNYVFEIYILQRLPMLLLKKVIHNKIQYFIICFIITIFLAMIFKFITDRTDKLYDKIVDGIAGKISGSSKKKNKKESQKPQKV